jgi:hypothetical protein
MKILDDFADLKEFARQVGRCERTVRRWCDEHGGLPHTRMGNRILIPVPQAREWLLKGMKNDPARAGKRGRRDMPHDPGAMNGRTYVVRPDGTVDNHDKTFKSIRAFEAHLAKKRRARDREIGGHAGR